MDTTRRQFLVATAGSLLLAAAPLSANGETSKPLPISLEGIKMDPGITVSLLMSAGATPVLTKPIDPTTVVRHETPSGLQKASSSSSPLPPVPPSPLPSAPRPPWSSPSSTDGCPLKRTIKSAKTGKEYVAFDCVVRVYEEPTKFRISITGS